MRLTHNMYSLSIYKNYKNELAQNAKAVANISSGKKLNSAKDDPNKIAEADKLKISIASRQQASANVQDVNSMLQTFDGGLQQMNDNISRLKSLTVQAGNDTNTSNDKQTIQSEIDGILGSINDLANNTQFNGIKLTQDPTTASGKQTVIGDESGDSMNIPFFDVTTTGLGLAGLNVTSGNVGTAISAVDSAVTKVTSIRSKYGAIESRLEGTLNNYGEVTDSLTSAQSSIEDADIATEYLNNSTSQVLIQAGISLISQSNQLPQNALDILARVK